MLAFFNLHIILLKLLVLWRLFRFWALIDGIDPLENVVRCMSDNYSSFAFWRGRHRSFNHWIVRYIYVLLGGEAGSSLETIAIASFLAKRWRDLPMAYRMLCGIGAMFNVLMMMAANLVGFTLGLDGLKGLFSGIAGSWQGTAFMLGPSSL